MVDILAAVFLDLVIGDPKWMPHPVRLMGRIISWEERIIRRITGSRTGLKTAGLLMVILNILLAASVPIILLKALDGFPIVQRIIRIYLIYTCIAARNLRDEALKVSSELDRSLEDGRKRLSYIVGRDTRNLSQEEVVRATVETVSENTSDGVIAPLMYVMIFGIPGGMIYKFVNTMDSMVGYKDEKYGELGYFPAKTDDLLNLVPSRLTALLMIISAPFGSDRRKAFQIVGRDGRNHRSPNSGYPESAAAGLLSVQLGGSNSYNGMVVHKPTLGDPDKALRQSHIEDSIRLMFGAELLLVLIFLVVNLF